LQKKSHSSVTTILETKCHFSIMSKMKERFPLLQPLTKSRKKPILIRGTIHILPQQKGGWWVGLAEMLT
jgi:hypothetical protein